MDSPLVGHSSANPPGIYPVHGERGVLRYWDGREWTGGPVASTSNRIWGNVVDVFLASIIFALVLGVFAIPVPRSNDPEATPDPALMNVAVLSAIIVGFGGYFAVSYRLWGRTLGMVMSGTRLVHIPSGERRLPWGPAVLRSLVLTAGYACGVLWIVWLALTAASKTKQGPHDLAAKTGVLTSGTSTAPPPPAKTTSSPTTPTVNLRDPAPAPTPAAVPDPTTPAPMLAPVDVPARAAKGDGPATIFISHASEDGATAQGLAGALEAQGLSTWLASRDVSIGANYAAEIFQNLVSSDYLLVVLSPNSIESAHVRREVSIAIDRKVPVLPVSTDPTGELMANLPEDWQYWLNIAQVFRMTDEESTAIEIARRVK